MLALSSERVVNNSNKYEPLDKNPTSKTSRLNKSDLIVRNYEFDIEKSQISIIEKCASSNRGENTPNKSTNSLIVCIICFINPPNAVLMNCGHGG